MIENFEIEYSDAEIAVRNLDGRISLLLSTREGTVPLDREFGLDMDFLDMPTETAKSLYTAEITRKIAQFIPEVRVGAVTWSAGEAGTIIPKVVITGAN